MSEQDAKAPRRDLEQKLLEVGGQCPVRRLEQEVLTGLAIGHEAKLRVTGLMRPEQVDLASRHHIDLRPYG
jgi:hypothetical protein